MVGPFIRKLPMLNAHSSAIPKDPLEYAVAARDSDVMGMVRTAIRTGNTQLAYQPIVLAEKPTQVAFYEGLIRVRDGQGRIIPAHQFMPNIEECALGRDIDCASIGLGIRMLREHPHMRLAINMSARSMADAQWRRTLDAALANDPTVAARLILEISESSAMILHEVLIRFMAEMQPLGVCFSLDDFGAGMTSFRRLKDFFFDMVKIDRCFVRDIDKSPDNQVMAEALINVAHQFEMFTIAEGVETQAEAKLLTDLGVDCLQGYLFGVPKLTG